MASQGSGGQIIQSMASGSSRRPRPRPAEEGPEEDAALRMQASMVALQTLLLKYEGKIRQQVGWLSSD